LPLTKNIIVNILLIWNNFSDAKFSVLKSWTTGWWVCLWPNFMMICKLYNYKKFIIFLAIACHSLLPEFFYKLTTESNIIHISNQVLTKLLLHANIWGRCTSSVMFPLFMWRLATLNT
jgi:hypothetical protein